MSFAELISKVNILVCQFSSCQIRLVDDNYVDIKDVRFDAEQDVDGFWLIRICLCV